MTIKTILVHLDDDADCAGRCHAAMALAARLGAELVGVRTASAAESDAEPREFLAECASRGVSGQWTDAPGAPMAALARLLRFADLAVVSRAAPDAQGERLERLVFVADGPVVVLPHGSFTSDFGRVVLVAWKPRREATQAVRAALPILLAADRVVVLTVGARAILHDSGAEMAARLKRIGAPAEARALRSADRDAGAAVLDQANAIDADIAVLGARGQSRMSELLLGGATRQVLASAPLPLLLAR